MIWKGAVDELETSGRSMSDLWSRGYDLCSISRTKWGPDEVDTAKRKIISDAKYSLECLRCTYLNRLEGKPYRGITLDDLEEDNDYVTTPDIELAKTAAAEEAANIEPGSPGSFSEVRIALKKNNIRVPYRKANSGRFMRHDQYIDAPSPFQSPLPRAGRAPTPSSLCD